LGVFQPGTLNPEPLNLGLGISSPRGGWPRFGLITIEKVIHQRKKAAGPFVANHQRDYGPVGKCARVAPGAHPHTYIAVGADLSPVAEAGLRIQLPSHSALELLLISIWNRSGGTAVCTFFAKAAKILDTDVHRMIDNQRQIGGHGKDSDPRTQLFGDQISETAHFPQNSEK